MNRNNDTVTEIIKGQKLQVAQDLIPNPIPVYETNPKILKDSVQKTIKTTGSGSNSINIGTDLGNTSNDFYLTSLRVAFNKNAACDIATGTIDVTALIGGVSTIIHSSPVITLESNRLNEQYIFPHPLKIDKNTAITQSGTFTAGILVRSISVNGFFDNGN
jgi:hypothetical protein